MSFTGADGACTEPEKAAEGGGCSADGSLQDQLTVSVTAGPGVSTPTTPAPITTFVRTPLPGSGTAQIAGGGSVSHTLRFALPNDSSTTAESNSNNNAQGDSVTLNSTFDLVQAT
ncbi:hypothetical protein LWC35_07075 [Pseudonocardia kujensis]|uniref:hypothetical protein n=1 Tax=Pseudonocardia kujensis TaxID=1128675 RepID=UPI001E4A555E|nr:hypothetical protein [Pseudonocardia kujensis]MCE0762671.1 hypothetical protein [Pseudonocardia kujensis]